MHDIIFRLRKRAEIRRQITTRKSVQEGAPDRIADLLEEAASVIEKQDLKITQLTIEIFTSTQTQRDLFEVSADGRYKVEERYHCNAPDEIERIMNMRETYETANSERPTQ